MENNNIYNESYRRNFLKNADFRSLNSYLMNMEKLSKKKGGKYLEMYNKDLDFLLQLGDKEQNKSNLFNFIGGGDLNKYSNFTLTETVCNTEGYLVKLNNITKNAFPTLDIMMSETDHNTKATLEELESIKNTLIDETFDPTPEKKWLSAIKRYINIIINAENYFSEEEYYVISTTYFREIPKLITANKNFIKESFLYLNKIINNNPTKISKNFVKAFAELRENKNNMSKEDFDKKKEDLIINFIEKGGFGLTMTSKFVEKLIDSYKKSLDK